MQLFTIKTTVSVYKLNLMDINQVTQVSMFVYIECGPTFQIFNLGLS